jgi:hypothetical protein
MCEMLYSEFWSGAFCWPRLELIELARRDVDARDDVALAQQLQLELLADLVAVVAIVDALLRERAADRGMDVVALGDVRRARRSASLRRLRRRGGRRAAAGSPSMIRRSRICLRSTLRGGSSAFCWTQARDDLVGLRIELADEHGPRR